MIAKIRQAYADNYQQKKDKAKAQNKKLQN